MSDIAIRVENLSKLYHIGAAPRHDTLRDALVARFRRSDQTAISRSADTDLWALRDVSFEIKRGEVVGVIGRNGAGKSTLLKILSRITEPTSGLAEIHGRVGSLLEVGTGFHPELTGRENIYLNGAILGMKRAEIERRFNEIVAFSEIDKFLDTPVKRYSSGMYVRLAFAVAAHLEPEILLVDEVLAVGDAAFQQKCLGKMGDVAHEGRTVLFVSHNMGAVVELCPESMLIQDGQVVSIAQSDKVIRGYLNSDESMVPAVSFDPKGNPHIEMSVTKVWIADSSGTPLKVVSATKSFSVGLELLVRDIVPDVEVSVRIGTAMGQPLFTSNLSQSLIRSELILGCNRYSVMMPGNFLAPGVYLLSIGIHVPNVRIIEFRERCLSFHIEETGTEMWMYRGGDTGTILTRFDWHPTSALDEIPDL